MIGGHKDDILVIQFPSTIINNDVDVKKFKKAMGFENISYHIMLLPCYLDYWKVNWVSGMDATEVITYIKEHCPWVSIPMEGGEIVL